MIKSLLLGGLIFIMVDILFILCACVLSSEYDNS